jgi:hypothetical protein
MMNRVVLLLVVGLAPAVSAAPAPLAVPAPIPAAAAVEMPAPKVVYVDDLRPGENVLPALVRIVTDALLAEAPRNGPRYLGRTDLNALLTEEKRRDLLGCSEISCLGELGGAVGADAIVHGDLSGFGTTLFLTVSLVDVASVRSLGRSTVEIHGPNEVRSAAKAAMTELLARRATP